VALKKIPAMMRELAPKLVDTSSLRFLLAKLR
jgi:hypothetical protein